MVPRADNKFHRPAPLKRSVIFNTPTSRSAPGASAKLPIAHRTQQEQPAMATSFLQFCATCEGQIYTPSNSILYCSEACRRKDSTKPVSPAPMASPSPPHSFSPTRPILPSRFPTGSPGSPSSKRLLVEAHTTSSKLDPTEWKPKLSGCGTSNGSEAFHYLSRFHRSTANLDGRSYMDPCQRPTLRSGYASTASILSLNPANTPSLAQSPTTASSSLSTNTDYLTPAYDFNTRPLPPRHDPSYSSSASVTRGIELVMPHAAAHPDCAMAGSAPNPGPLHGELWEKQKVKGLPKIADSDAKEGLAALFAASHKK